MRYPETGYTGPVDNQHAAAEAIRRRDGPIDSAHPNPTSRSQLPAGSHQASVSASTPARNHPQQQHAEVKRRRSDTPAYLLAFSLMGGTAYLIGRARHRTQARYIALQRSRDRAIGQSIGWKHAYLAREGVPSFGVRAVKSPPYQEYKPPSPPRHQRDERARPRNLPGGFMDPRIAEQAKRQEQHALDPAPLTDYFVDAVCNLWGLATGKTIGSDEQSQDLRHKKTPQRDQNHHWRKYTHLCDPDGFARQEPKRSSLSPAQRWRRAFGPGASGLESDHSGWEELAKSKAAQARKNSEMPQDCSAKAGSNANGSSEERSPPYRAKKRAEAPLQQSQRKIRVNDALHDELDCNFLRRHIDKSKSSAISSGTRLTETRQEKEEKGQHISMDNLFLETQLEDAVIEGREARERLQKRIEASNASPLLGKAARENDEVDAKAARLTELPLYGNEHETITDEVAAEFFKGDGRAEGGVKGTSDAKSTQSLWEAALESAEGEGTAIRHRREAEQRRRQQQRDEKIEAERAAVTAAAAIEAAAARDAQPRRTVLEPEDLDEALVLHELSQGRHHAPTAAAAEEEGTESALNEGESVKAIDEDDLHRLEEGGFLFGCPESAVDSDLATSTSISTTRFVSMEARLDVASAEVRQLRYQLTRLERKLSPPSTSLSYTSFLAIEARLDGASTEVRLLRSQMNRLQRRMNEVDGGEGRKSNGVALRSCLRGVPFRDLPTPITTSPCTPFSSRDLSGSQVKSTAMPRLSV